MNAYLDDAAVRRSLRLEALIPAIRQALIDLSTGRVVQPLRMVMDIPAEEGMLFLKPALSGNTLATKLITLMPRNPERGLPTLRFQPDWAVCHLLPGCQDDHWSVAQRGRRLEEGVVGRPLQPFGGLGDKTLP